MCARLVVIPAKCKYSDAALASVITAIDALIRAGHSHIGAVLWAIADKRIKFKHVAKADRLLIASNLPVKSNKVAAVVLYVLQIYYPREMFAEQVNVEPQ